VPQYSSFPVSAGLVARHTGNRHVRIVDPQEAQGSEPLVTYVVLASAHLPAEALFSPRVTIQPGKKPDPRAEPVEAIRVDTDRRTVHVDGRLLELTYLEFELLAHLVAHPHRVQSRSHLVEAVWDYRYTGDTRTVDVHIARLRRKLGPHHRESVRTIRRVGYSYVPAGC
jgi:DNA-binding response OmpR family regulator